MSDKRYDGAEDISRMTGLSRDKVISLWEEVKENVRRLDGCERHKFDAPLVKIGEKLTCQNCGGVLSLSDISQYVRGFRAAGGDPELVYPGFFKARG